jgi:integrase
MEGHICKRSKNSWTIVIDRGRGPDGRRRQSWHTVRGTKRDAERERARLIHEVNTGAYVEPAKLTVAEYLEQWLRDCAVTKVCGKTFERYEEIVQRHLIPALGHHRLDKLQPLHIQAYYASALKDGRLDGKGGLSKQTVLHHHRVLRQALQQGVRWQLLSRNPADAAQPPRPPRREMQVHDEDETALLLDAAKGNRNYVPVLMAVSTGLRRGEILALRWQDVDLDKATLAVRQTLEQTRKGGLAFKEAKTKNSRRLVAMPAILVEALRKLRIAQGQQRLALGTAYQDHGLVFPDDDGTPRSPNALSVAFRDLVARVAVPRVRLHDQRHTHASQLSKQGVPVKVISERLGHASGGITLDLYSHVLPGMQEDAARRVDAALRAAIARKK